MVRSTVVKVSFGSVNDIQNQSTHDVECFSCTLASSHSWDDTTESHLASYAQEYTGCIFQNYGTVGIGEPMEIRVPSRRSLFRSLNLLLPLCNEDTGPVTPALIISGCDIQRLGGDVGAATTRGGAVCDVGD
ncbi:hypothetical protein HanRHA438_Chr17g0799401 [Helianthus annuus]|nr:hypothetical protein HanHA89_Chr17g0694821 [Helianthus annuus]KAJ0825092.1 hypothetical protein HanRHA438_Chr17g0799401 [Helianthus annuus]